MKHPSVAFWLSAMALLLLPHVAMAEPPHAHPQAASATSAATSPAQRWASDLPLRTGMRRIQSVVAALQHNEHGHMSAQQAVAASRLIKQHASYLVSNCRLDPEPDAALHAIIASLLQAAAALEADPGDPAAVATMRAALDAYPRQFDDRDWEPAASGH